MSNEPFHIEYDDSGLKQLLKDADAGILAGAVNGVKIASIALIGMMMRKAPIMTGLLRSSGSVWWNGKPVFKSPKQTKEKVEHPSSVPSTDALDVTFGFNTPYAAYQDTRRDLHHPLGGQAGYFTDTLQGASKLIEKFVVAEIKKALKAKLGRDFSV